MSNSPNIDNEKAKTTEDPKTHSSPERRESGYVEFERSDQKPERIERLGQYLSHTTKNSSNVDERNTTAYGNTETSTLDIPHQSGKTRADYEISSPEVPSSENPTFLDDVGTYRRAKFEIQGKDYETFPRDVVEESIPEDDKVRSPNLDYGDGHKLLQGNATRITDKLIEKGKTQIMKNSRWAGVGQKRFPQDDPSRFAPNTWNRTNRFEPMAASSYSDYRHPTGQSMAEVEGNDLAKFWPEYQRRLAKFGPASQQAVMGTTGVESIDVENVFEDFETVDSNIQTEEIPSLTDTTYGQKYNSENQFETTEYVHQVPNTQKRVPFEIPIPDVTGPLNHPSIRTAETRMNGSLRSRLALGNVPSLMLNPPNAKANAKKMEDAGLGKNNYGQMEAYNSTLWTNTPGDIKRKEIKEKVGKRYQEREDGRFTPEQVRLMEDMLEAEHMPFYIQDLRTNEIIGFHAFLNTISDSYSGEWSAQKGFGRLEAAQIYGGGSRSIGVSFTMVAMNPADFDEMYVKINKLTTLVYPQWSQGTMMQQGENKFVQPFSQVPTASPLCRIRVGDLFTSNYSKKAMARMMGIEDVNFVYEGLQSDPEPSEETPEKQRGKLGEAIDRMKEKLEPHIDEAKWYLKIHFWSVIQKLLEQYGIPHVLFPEIQRFFEANHKLFKPKIRTLIVPPVNTEQIPSAKIAEKADKLIDSLKGEANDKIDAMIAKGTQELQAQTGEIGSPYLGSAQTYMKGIKTDALDQMESQVRDNEFVTESFKQQTKIDKQIEQLRALEQINPERPVELYQLTISIPPVKVSPIPMAGFPGGILPLPPVLPFHTPSIDKQELLNYIGESGYFEHAPIQEEEPPADEADSQGAIPFKTKKEKPPKGMIDLFNSEKNPIFRAFESSMGRGIAVAINSIGLEWKLGSAPWNMEVGARAPRMCEVSLGLIPIHDITPGLDHNGINRAPIYKVGSSRDLTGDVWYNDEEFKDLQKNIKRDTLVALVPWGEIVKGVIE